MAKIYKYSGRGFKGTIVGYSNLSEYYRQLEEPGLNGRNDSSQDRGDSGWAGTNSYAEAEDLMYSGDEKSYQKLMELKTETDKYYIAEAGSKVRSFNDVVGYTPNVPNAILGLPQSMINAKREPKKHRVIDVLINRSRSGMTSTKQIEYEGALILSFIDALERDGFRVNLSVGKISWFRMEDEVTGHFVPIKLATDPLNVKKTAYYLVNPAYLRRTAFRIDENESRLPNITYDGYGSVNNRDKMHEFMLSEVSERLLIVDDSLNLDMDDDTEYNIDKLNNLFKKSK